MFALLPPPPTNIHFSMVLLHLKGIAAFQTFKGARNQWFGYQTGNSKPFRSFELAGRAGSETITFL